MNIKDKLVLINAPPYSTSGANITPANFITVEIIDIKESEPSPYTGRIETGYIAQGSDGYTYTLDYPLPQNHAGLQTWTRWMPEEKYKALPEDEQIKIARDYIWYDLVTWQCPEKAVPISHLEFVEYCEFHQEHYYTRKGCQRCEHNLSRPRTIMSKKNHAWSGWY